MAKILQERENERKENRKNRCKCASKISLPLVDAQTMTPPSCTISYADFDFSDFDDEDEDDNVIDEEDEEEDIIYGNAHVKNRYSHIVFLFQFISKN